MTAPILNHHHDRPNNAQKHLRWCCRFAVICAGNRAGHEFNAGAPLERTNWASVCRVLRTFDVSKSRQQLESRPNEHGSQRKNNS